MILKSMFSMAALNMVKAACSLLISFLVAKTVAPDAFGLVSFAVPLMTFITILTDLGLASAIVRHPSLSRDEAGTAVALLLTAGAAGGVLLSLVAWPLEHLVGLAGLAQVLIGFGLVTLFTIWAAAPRALLERQYAYRKIAMVEFPALLAGLAACGVAIWLEQGIMAIVAYQATMQLIRATGMLALARSSFRLNAHWANLRGLASVGGWLLITNILTYLARNLDNILIGAYLGARTLGIYGLAYQFMTLPLILITWPVSGVLLSTLARLRDVPGARQDVICGVIMCTAALTFPGMAFLTFAAGVPLDLIYSNKWQGLATAVALLAPAGAAQSIAAYGGAVLVERGAVKLNFVLSILIGSSFVAVFFATVWFGLSTLITAYTVVSALVCVMHVHFICKVSGIPHRRLFACLLPGLAAVGVALAGTYLVAGLSPVDLIGWLKAVAIYAVLAGGVLILFAPKIIHAVRLLAQSGAHVGTKTEATAGSGAATVTAVGATTAPAAAGTPAA